jgi:hypothetical protein
MNQHLFNAEFYKLDCRTQKERIEPIEYDAAIGYSPDGK